MEDSSVLVGRKEVKKLITECVQSTGGSCENAQNLAEVMTVADERGIYSHGLNRLDLYCKMLKEGSMDGRTKPEIIKETVATALVDGKNTLGPTIGKFCMELAIKKAKEAGVGLVTANNSNHFGIAAWYSMMALEHGCVGLAFTNSDVFSVPTRSNEKAVGTNPISMAAPGTQAEDSFVLDMATTTVPVGKIEVAHRKGVQVPEGWIVDKEGKSTTDPADVLQRGGGLTPLGGSDVTSGYKGYGLGMMVEILTSVLAGGNITKDIPWFWGSNHAPANLGQCFMAINTEAFAAGFSERLTYLVKSCRNLTPTDDYDEVLVAGDPERKHSEMCDNLGAIPYHCSIVHHANKFAETLGVSPLKFSTKK